MDVSYERFPPGFAYNANNNHSNVVAPQKQQAGPATAYVPPKVHKIAYHHHTFADFCSLIGRMFYDDACIILLDFLVKEQRAFTESDIRERLKWKENLLHQKLYFLERQLLIQREHNFEKGSKSPIYWRISPHIVIAVDWHLEKIVEEICHQVDMSQSLHEFECPVCNLKYSALDVASGVRALDDDFPLCRKCGGNLCVSNSEEAKQDVKDRQQRAMIQLAALSDGINRIKNMEIPVFEKYTRADKNEQKRENERAVTSTDPNGSTGDTGSSVVPTGTVNASTMSSSESSSIPSLQTGGVAMGSGMPIGVTAKSPLSGIFMSNPQQSHMSAGLSPTATTGNRNTGAAGAAGVGVGSFSLSIASAAVPPQRPQAKSTASHSSSRVIPWFEKTH